MNSGKINFNLFRNTTLYTWKLEKGVVNKVWNLEKYYLRLKNSFKFFLNETEKRFSQSLTDRKKNWYSVICVYALFFVLVFVSLFVSEKFSKILKTIFWKRLNLEKRYPQICRSLKLSLPVTFFSSCSNSVIQLFLQIVFALLTNLCSDTQNITFCSHKLSIHILYRLILGSLNK